MLRRRFLPLIAVVIAAPAGAQTPSGRTSVSDLQILHVLNRLTFGPRPGDIETVRQMGMENWIQSQLHPENIPENPVLEERLNPLATLKFNLVESVEYLSGGIFTNIVAPDGTILTRTFSVGNVLVAPEATMQSGSTVDMMRTRRSPDADLKEGKVFRALYSNRQLEEVLVDFWFNHFNVTSAKGSPFVADYEREAIRPHVLGKFKDMLVATAIHPAMLRYLDNIESIAPEIAQPNGPNLTRYFGSARGLNENFSRELMELHTLGVDGGYTQKDIEAAARCFTGWSLRQTASSGSTKERAKVVLVFEQWPHDPNDKIVLGHTIPGGGREEVYELLDILARQPSTARHISKQLAQRFISDNPPQALVDRMSKTFMETDGDLRAVMTTMLTSPQFLSQEIWETKLKSPLELVSSAVRAVDGDAKDASILTRWIADMGEPLYGKIEPTGYPNTGETWFNTVSLLARLNFATTLAAGNIPGVTLDSSRWSGTDAPSIARDILGRTLSPATLDVLKKGAVAAEITPSFIAGLILGSPDFQRR